MSKLITIPTWRNPYEVEINGKKYSYSAGARPYVPDEVAEVIERDIAQHTPAEEPALTQPRWGAYKDAYEATIKGNYDGTEGCVAEVDYDTYALLLEQNAVATLYDYDDKEIGTIPVSDMPYETYDINQSDRYVDCLLYRGDARSFAITYVKEVEKVVPITSAYVDAGITFFIVRFTYDYDNEFYTADKSDDEIIAAAQSGKIVCGLWDSYDTYTQHIGCDISVGGYSDKAVRIGDLRSNLDGTWQ